MKSLRFTLPLLLAGLLFGVSAQVNAMPGPDGVMAGPGMSPNPEMGPMGPGHEPGKRGPRSIFAGMNAEQKAKAMAIVKEYDPKIQALRDEQFIKQHELRALENAATPNLQAVRAEAGKLLELVKQIRELEREKMEKIRKEVGPVQRPARGPKEAKPGKAPM